jgi:hypothetical protein
MKKVILSISVLAAVFFYVACTPEKPAVFEQADGIYFNAASDTLTYTFAKYPNRVKDTLWIPVRLLGNASQNDQPITIEKGAGADVTAMEGVHYKLMDTYTMPAGKFSTTLPVIVYRTPDLEAAAVSFKLELKANEHFALGITSKAGIKVNLGFLQKPTNWGDFGGGSGLWAGYSTNFGTWTKTKYKLILDALYDPVGDTTISEFPYPRFSPPAITFQYLQIVKNYLRTNYPGNFSVPVGTGPTLRDPDAGNLHILVGPANY